MAIINKINIDDYVERNDNRLHFIKCKFEDLPTTAKNVSVFIDNNVLYFVDNETIPRISSEIIFDNNITLY